MNAIGELKQKGQELKQRIAKFGAPIGNQNAAGPHNKQGSGQTGYHAAAASAQKASADAYAATRRAIQTDKPEHHALAADANNAASKAHRYARDVLTTGIHDVHGKDFSSAWQHHTNMSFQHHEQASDHEQRPKGGRMVISGLPKSGEVKGGAWMKTLDRKGKSTTVFIPDK